MPSLLKEIQAAAVDANVPIANVLRKCAVLAAQLKNDELRDWAFRELNGYDAAEVPEYRILGAPTRAHLHVGGWEYKATQLASLALPEKLQERAEVLKFSEPIATVEALVRDAETSTLMQQWPGNLVLWVQKEGKFSKGAHVIIHSIWQEVATASVLGIIDAVRNRILEFCLRLAKESPDLLADDVEAPSPDAESAAKQVFNQVFVMGDNTGNIASGSPGSMQAAQTVEQGDLAGLLKLLTDSGVPAVEVQELGAALEEEKTAQGIGPKAKAWLAKATKAIGSGAWTVAKGVTTTTITKAVLAYFGIPS